MTGVVCRVDGTAGAAIVVYESHSFLGVVLVHTIHHHSIETVSTQVQIVGLMSILFLSTMLAVATTALGTALAAPTSTRFWMLLFMLF